MVQAFYTLPVTQPTLKGIQSIESNKGKITNWLHPFLIHQMTHDGMDTAII